MSETETNAAVNAAASAAPSPDVLDRIEHVINKIRPYIQQDGGDVQLVDFKDGVVTVRMLGACAGCFAVDQDITEGIQAILLDEVPEVKEVKLDTAYAEGNSGNTFSWY